MVWEVAPFLFIFGLAWGSFLNVCIYRLPRGESIVIPPSSCTSCGKGIAWHDNIPLLGWLWLRGRCRQCGAGISVIYPLIELIAALLTLQVWYRFGLTPEAGAVLVLGYAFLVLLVIDLFHYILPDVITLPGILLGLLLAWIPEIGTPPLANFHDALIGAAAGGGGLWAFAWIFEKLTGKVGMGLGDVKLFAMIGAWLGWQALPLTLFLAALTGSVVGIVWILVAGRDRTLPIPFGPYLVAGAWLHIFYGLPIQSWYLG